MRPIVGWLDDARLEVAASSSTPTYACVTWTSRDDARRVRVLRRPTPRRPRSPDPRRAARQPGRGSEPLALVAIVGSSSSRRRPTRCPRPRVTGRDRAGRGDSIRTSPASPSSFEHHGRRLRRLVRRRPTGDAGAGRSALERAIARPTVSARWRRRCDRQVDTWLDRAIARSGSARHSRRPGDRDPPSVPLGLDPGDHRRGLASWRDDARRARRHRWPGLVRDRRRLDPGSRRSCVIDSSLLTWRRSTPPRDGRPRVDQPSSDDLVEMPVRGEERPAVDRAAALEVGRPATGLLDEQRAARRHPRPSGRPRSSPRRRPRRPGHSPRSRRTRARARHRAGAAPKPGARPDAAMSRPEP